MFGSLVVWRTVRSINIILPKYLEGTWVCPQLQAQHQILKKPKKRWLYNQGCDKAT